MTFEEFRATKKPCSDALWDMIKDALPGFTAPREACHEYADFCLLYEEGGLFWVHAWWYAPLSYQTLEEAEPELYKWHQEFA